MFFTHSATFRFFAQILERLSNMYAWNSWNGNEWNNCMRQRLLRLQNLPFLSSQKHRKQEDSEQKMDQQKN